MSINALSRTEIEYIFKQSEVMSKKKLNETRTILQEKKLGLMFYQASTRTRFSFEAAMLNLGGQVLGFSEISSIRSGDFFKESLEDTIQVVAQMVDCIVLRHPSTAAVNNAFMLSPVPVINGGDGSNEHPTQALLDLWMIHKYLGSLDGIKIGLVGDASTRVIRSILLGLSKFKPQKILFLLPPHAQLPDDMKLLLMNNNIAYQFYDDICDLLKEADALEMLPIHLPDLTSSDNRQTAEGLVTADRYRLTKEKIIKTGSIVPILHPGPRLDEMSPDVDDLPQTLYFKQVKSSVFLRMVLLEELILC
jgi:aspartate carbamoyltransferase catalytic subunit